jgi:ankyrin repeat protein
MASRERNIQEAQINTCNWFLDTDVFKNWHSRTNVRVDAGLLWVKGKPGSGKSTLMKHAVDWMEKIEGSHATVASFYFNARGADLEKATLGLFRSILHQICVQDRTVRAEFLDLYKSRSRRATLAEELSWTQSELQAFIRRVFREGKPRQSFIFIDALDECELQAVRDVVYFFAEIAKLALEHGLCLNICLSSRHYPTIGLPHCPEVIVEAGNEADIAAYIRDRFSFAPPSEASIVAKLQSSIAEKAAGVFLWVVLIVDLLLQDLDSGQSMDRLTKRLNQIPRSMEDLYADRCRSISAEERAFSVSLIQWVLYGGNIIDHASFHPPGTTVLAAHFSVPGVRFQSGVDDCFFDTDAQAYERSIRRIKNASRGLVECTNNFWRIQFIHETAREFFSTGPGFGLLEPSLAEDPKGFSYTALKRGCINIIEAAAGYLRPDSWLSWFVAGARKEVIDYAREVESRGGSNIDIVEGLTAGRYNELHPGQSPLRFVTRVGLTSCALALLEQGVPPDEAGHSNTRSRSAVVDGRRFGEWDPGDPNGVFLEFSAGLQGVKSDDSGYSYMTPLAVLCCPSRLNTYPGSQDKVNKAFMKSLVMHGANLECRNEHGMTPLLFTVAYGYFDMAEFLIISGADVNATCSDHGIPVLQYAVYSRRLTGINIRPTPAEYHKLLELLLARGADHNYESPKEPMALHAVVTSCASADTARLVINAGVDVNAVDGDGKTALHHATTRADEPCALELIQLLVEAGCPRAVRDKNGQTALDVALEVNPEIGAEMRTLLTCTGGEPPETEGPDVDRKA